MHAFEKKFLEHCQTRKFFQKGERVLVAFSGGADSTALLHLLAAVRFILKIEIAAAHCNFQLRARASLGDERFCQQTCSLLGITLFTERFDTKDIAKTKKLSLEETARHLRYDFFARLMQIHQFDKLVTAHHAGDNAETVLFNFFRGASLLGLSGIPERREYILRPLLNFERDDILAYLNDKHLSYRTDHTNFELCFDRNFIRHKVIPLIEERFEHKLVPSLLRFSKHVTELSEFVEGHIQKLMRKRGLSFKHHAFEVRALKALTKFEQKEIFKRALQCCGVAPSAQLLDRLAGLLERQSGRKIVVSAHLEVIWKGDKIFFSQKAPTLKA
ncbi:MAG: tRNA lysidine(34) synthetase TilS [Candidatus Thermochlorobacter sp.]